MFVLFFLTMSEQDNQEFLKFMNIITLLAYFMDMQMIDLGMGRVSWTICNVITRVDMRGRRKVRVRAGGVTMEAEAGVT